MAGKIAIVTGAGNGIGRGIAHAFVREGMTVIATDVDGPALDETLRLLGDGHGNIVSRCLDVSDNTEIERLSTWVMDQFGRLDILVNCAGVTRKIDFFDITADDVDWINSVNVRGTLLMMQATARIMRPQGSGHIVNISSIAGKGFRETTNIAYAASKGAIITMSRIAAARLGEYGITVNSVCPGMTETDMMRSWMEATARQRQKSLNETRQELVRDVALKRTNSVEDIAATVLFLVSPAARNITGQSINVDGGVMWD